MARFVCIVLFAICTLFSCCHVDTNPILAYMDVKSSIHDRTGQTIFWKETAKCDLENWLHCTLQQELTKDQVIQIALINNPSLKATYETLGIAQARIVQAELLTNPLLQFSMKHKNFIESSSIIEMSVLQNILDILLKPMKRKIACSQLEFTKAKVTAHVMDVIADTLLAFYTLQAQEEDWELQKEIVEVTELAYEVAKRLFKVGNVAALFVTTKRLQWERAKLELISSESMIVETKEKLNLLMGLKKGPSNWKITNLLEEIPMPEITTVDVETHALINSLDLLMAEQTFRTTAAIVGKDATELIFREANLGIDSEKEPHGGWFVGPQFSVGVPLFDTGQAMSLALSAELSRQWHAYIALRFKIQSTARVLRFQLENAAKQSRLTKNSLIPRSEQVIKDTLLFVNAMQLNVFELLSAKEELIKIKRQELHAFKEYWTARTTLETLLQGRLLHQVEIKKEVEIP